MATCKKLQVAIFIEVVSLSDSRKTLILAIVSDFVSDFGGEMSDLWV
jgi:hypothetical protein